MLQKSIGQPEILLQRRTEMAGTPLQEPSEKKSSNVFTFCSKHKTRIALGLFYFFFETSFNFKMFFLPVYWQQLGLSPTQIGILRAVWGRCVLLGNGHLWENGEQVENPAGIVADERFVHGYNTASFLASKENT